MPRYSAGLLPVRFVAEEIEVLLVHPGGPFWQKKDNGAWSIAKGEYASDEDPLAAAEREFVEEIGHEPPPGDRIPLGDLRQAGGKVVVAWAVVGDIDVQAIVSNTFALEWPPTSGRFQDFPEVDRAAWFSLDEARVKLLTSQVPFLERLSEHFRSSGTT
jgi:predicted NUDIX family NTP pyrophosphohydrolase